jgi:hypothetical protein
MPPLISFGQIRLVLPRTTLYYRGNPQSNGTDYSTIPDSVVFSANDSIASIVITPLVFQGAQSNKTITIYLLSNNCGSMPYDSITLIIMDSVHLHIVAPNFVCQGEQFQLLATGVPSWHLASWHSILNDSTISNPIAQTLQSTNLCRRIQFRNLYGSRLSTNKCRKRAYTNIRD